MARKISVVVSQGRSPNPAKRQLEEDLVAAFLMDSQVDVTVVPHLYDLAADSSGILCLQGMSGDLVVLSWLYPRAIHWVLSRNGIKGHEGESLLVADEGDEDDELEGEETGEEEDGPEALGPGEVPNRKIYAIDLRVADDAQKYIDEIKRIASEAAVQTVDLMGFIGGTPKAESLERYITPAPGNVDAKAASGNGNTSAEAITTGDDSADGNGSVRITEEPARRWYPVIDYSRCTNCLECIDFCLFGVYGMDVADAILVEQPDNCRKGCPACSRVCPANAIIFPEHKTPAIAGSPLADTGSFKIDLSKLFGAPEGDAVDIAVRERDVELVRDGRDAVGMAVGIPKRHSGERTEPKDDLDNLIDELDDLEL